MIDTVARSPRAASLAIAMAVSLVATTQADATTHHHHASTSRHAHKATHGHASSSHHGASKKASKKAKPTPSKPAGVTSIPAGGLKVYCPAGRNPLMIRKMTQGNGTTVTIVCR